MNDPRKGKPSASGVERLALCPGSWNLESKLPPEPESDDAAAGTRIHDALAGSIDPKTLGVDEFDTYSRILDMEKEALAIWKSTLPEDGDPIVVREERLWMESESGEPLFSGQFDVCFMIGKEALLLDAKSGRGEVQSSEGNFQLMALASLIGERFPHIEAVTVAILAPYAPN